MTSPEERAREKNRNTETEKKGEETSRRSAHLLGFRDDHRGAPGADVDLRVLGVYGVQQLELELVVVVRLRAVRLGVRAEGQHAVVRQVHLGILRVRALQREEQPIFALRPVRERDPGGVAGDGGHRLDEQAARKHVALAEFLDGRVSRRE